MRLNMKIVADYLQDIVILLDSSEPTEIRTLKYAAFYQEGIAFSSDILYVAKSDDLRDIFPGSQHASMICIGYPPSQYYDADIELLCLASDTDIRVLFNQLQQIFAFFENTEEKLRHVIEKKEPFQAIAEILFPLFETPVYAFDRYEDCLFLGYDPQRPEYLSVYQNFFQTRNESTKERRLHLNDIEFRKSYETIGPHLFKTEIYETDTIYENIFFDKVYMGRFVIDNAYREFRGSDYTLVSWISEFLKQILCHSEKFTFGYSKEFDQMMKELLVEKMSWYPGYETLLTKFGWQIQDSYLCACIFIEDSYLRYTSLDKDAYYLKDLFEEHYILVAENIIYQIFNLSKSKYGKQEIEHSMSLFLAGNNCIAGFSSIYNDFRKITEASQQAFLCCSQKNMSDNQRIYFFDEEIISILLGRAKGSFHGNFFCTKAIRNLINYDRENQSDLMLTLKSYVKNNYNITKTMEEMHIARTSCLYRIQRIEKITGLDIKDHDVNLYLLILFRFLEKSLKMT